MVIKIKKDCCIGCGNCAAICPEVFEMASDGKAKVKKQKNAPCVDKAIAECPNQCISK